MNKIDNGETQHFDNFNPVLVFILTMNTNGTKMVEHIRSIRRDSVNGVRNFYIYWMMISFFFSDEEHSRSIVHSYFYRVNLEYLQSLVNNRTLTGESNI